MIFFSLFLIVFNFDAYAKQSLVSSCIKFVEPLKLIKTKFEKK